MLILSDMIQMTFSVIQIGFQFIEQNMSSTKNILNAVKLLFRFVIYFISKCSKIEENLWKIAKNCLLYKGSLLIKVFNTPFGSILVETFISEKPH